MTSAHKKKRIKKLSAEMKRKVWSGTKPDSFYDPRYDGGRINPVIDDPDMGTPVTPRYREKRK